MRQAVFGGLRHALARPPRSGTRQGLEFVVAPVPARDGELLRRLDGRYAVSVFSLLAGRSYSFGPYPDEPLRRQARLAAAHVPAFTGRGDPDAFLLDPGRPWDGGPFPQGARRLAAARAADLARLAAGFDHLAAVTDRRERTPSSATGSRTPPASCPQAVA